MSLSYLDPPVSKDTLSAQLLSYFSTVSLLKARSTRRKCASISPKYKNKQFTYPQTEYYSCNKNKFQKHLKQEGKKPLTQAYTLI